MRIYPFGLTIRAAALDLLKIYSSSIFVTGPNSPKFDRKVVELLMIEFIGIEDMQDGKRPEPHVMELMKSEIDSINFAPIKIRHFYFQQFIDIV